MESYTVYASTMASMDFGHIYGKNRSLLMCFVVSGSKVLEGVGSYVVDAVGTKSFDGRIMMG